MNAVFRPLVRALFLGFAVLFLGSTLPASSQEKSIRLRNERIQTPPRPAAAAIAPQAEDPVSGLQLIQLEAGLAPGQREALAALGVDLLVYVPEDAFIARLSGVMPSRVRALPFVRWMGAYRPDHKVDARVTAWAQAAPAEPTRQLSLLLSAQATAMERAMVARLFDKVDRQSQRGFGGLLQGRLHKSRIKALLASPAVLWVEPAPRMKLVDEVAARIVAGDGGPGRTRMQELGFDGTGVTVAVADSGLDTGNPSTMHPDIAGRVKSVFFYGALEDASDGHSHGTHVTGIVAGNGATGEVDENGALYGLGVAPGASVIAQRIFDDLGGYEPPDSNETLTRDAVRAGADIGSNSWGDDTQGRYDISAVEFDALVRDADAGTPGDQPYVLEFSAGNAGPGPQTIGSPAVAKNVIATGASQNNRLDLFLYGDGINAMADFSSRGPCEDDRIKPDVVAPGTWIASMKSSLASDENAWGSISPNYIYQGGTSQAGPQVSGAAAVFFQYYRQTRGRKPSPALVKAALINSAFDMDDAEGGTDPVPNMDEGWGRVNLPRLIGNSTVNYGMIDQTTNLATGQTFELHFVVLPGDEALRLTLAYTDVPAFPGAIPALVNDLDLEVTGPDGFVYRGNQFLDGESVPNAPAWDRINNVEGVHLFYPRPGEYVVRVRAVNVVQDSRQDTPAVDQDFALVISGTIPGSGVAAVILDRQSYSAPSQMRVTVLDPSKAGQPGLPVTVRSTTDSGGLTLQLKASASPTLFTGVVATAKSPAVVGDSILQISHQDDITVSYLSPAGEVVRTARADLVAPVITGVSAVPEFGTVNVVWTTDEDSTSVVSYGLAAPFLSRTNRTLSRAHSIELSRLSPDRTYRYFVVSTDEAGNVRTNDNAGKLFDFVAPRGKTVLLVDAYAPDELLETAFLPLSSYTASLEANGISYDVWDRNSRPPLTINNFKPYRVVIWRINDIDPFVTIAASEMSALASYVAGGGGFFMASMEALSRFSSSTFHAKLARVASFEADTGLGSAFGPEGDPVSGGLEFILSYANYDAFGLGELDFSDHVVPAADTAAFLVDGSGTAVVGTRYPANLATPGGRSIFLSFPLDTVSASGPNGGERAALMRRVIEFLAPGADGLGTLTLDSPSYRLPSVVGIEVGDSDRVGAGSLTVQAMSGVDPSGIPVTLFEIGKKGIFRGRLTVVPETEIPAPGRLRSRSGDTLTVRYLDGALANRPVVATAIVDVLPPAITAGPDAEPGYGDVTIRWTTSEAADALVEYGESTRLGRSAYRSANETDHEIVVEGLSPDRRYFFKITSRDVAGNVVTDDKRGALHTFRTLEPLGIPWGDDMDHGATNWVVVDSDLSQAGWKLGVPANGMETRAHSVPFAWGSNLGGGIQDQVETVLVSPAMFLSGGNSASLKFWHSYDFTQQEFDIFHGGELLMVTNNGVDYVTLATFGDSRSGWTEEVVDLTPYMGKMVYFAFHYVLFSFDSVPRPGWLVDDFNVEVTTAQTGVLRVTNSIAQARFSITGPVGFSGGGLSYENSTAPIGEYRVVFGDVPFYRTPPAATLTLGQGGTVTFTGSYDFADLNGNGISDAWEQQFFGAVSPHPPGTDSDQDGLSDLGEFLAGTDPKNVTSVLKVLSARTRPDGAIQLAWSSAPGRLYRIWSSPDLLSWSPAGDWVKGLAGQTGAILPVPKGSATGFLRVEVRP